MKDKIEKIVQSLSTQDNSDSDIRIIDELYFDELINDINNLFSDIKKDIQEQIKKHEKYYNRVFILKLEEIEFLQSLLNKLQ